MTKKESLINKNDLYQYSNCGLDYIFLSNNYYRIIQDQVYGEGISFIDIEKIHKEIANIVIKLNYRFRGKEFAFLIKELSLTQSQLSKIIGVDSRTIQNWEGGKNKYIPEYADKIIRTLYIEEKNKIPAFMKVCEIFSNKIKKIPKDFSILVKKNKITRKPEAIFNY